MNGFSPSTMISHFNCTNKSLNHHPWQATSLTMKICLANPGYLFQWTRIVLQWIIMLDKPLLLHEEGLTLEAASWITRVDHLSPLWSNIAGLGYQHLLVYLSSLWYSFTIKPNPESFNKTEEFGCYVSFRYLSKIRTQTQIIYWAISTAQNFPN